MNISQSIKKIFCLGAIISALVNVVACTGTQSFGLAARAGDTVAFAVGYNQALTKDNIQITITDANSTVFTYLPGDPAIRTVFNMYPDPVSRLVVGTDTGQSLGVGASTLGFNINSTVTSSDRDWSLSSVFIDLPATMATGTAIVKFADALGQPILSLGQEVDHNVEIIGPGGSPQTFNTHEFNAIGGLPGVLASLERTDHFTITFSGISSAEAIQVDLVHNPDSTVGGVGKAHAINTTGNLKSMAWSDDGTNMRVILTAAASSNSLIINDFKFYVAGDITGLLIVPSSVLAFDSNGNAISGLTASVQ
jgi:hypothetical protein